MVACILNFAVEGGGPHERSDAGARFGSLLKLLAFPTESPTKGKEMTNKRGNPAKTLSLQIQSSKYAGSCARNDD